MSELHGSDACAPLEVAPLVTWSAMAGKLAFVIAGNLVVGSVLAGLTYHVIHGRRPPAEPPLEPVEPVEQAKPP